ncbi:hypothetical protein [uncultured Roseobacter sp.]|uniref:hypothetical protein n=1 Tax=uncultured Roseobacter sp. TaxID=114847 RepID=UPI002611A7BE|nr:hypothetical protein [uncultured Roseobacter sp.]
MFYDLGTLNFDEKLRRYVYFEDYSSVADGDVFHAWMIEALFDPYKTITPHFINEVRYAERKHDPIAMEEKMEHIVVLGLSESTDYDQMRPRDRLDEDEIKIEITEGFMDSTITITLLKDINKSIEVLSGLRLFVEHRKHQKAA